MKKHLFLVIAIGISCIAIAQSPNLLDHGRIEQISSSQMDKIFERGTLLENRNDKLGYHHYKVQEQYKNYDIEGAVLNVIKNPDGSIKMTGISPTIQKDLPLYIIPFTQALETAKSTVSTNFFYWEDLEHERLIKKLENNSNASFYPKEHLVWLDTTFSNDGTKYILAYKIELYFEGEIDHKTIFIAANTGELLMDLQACSEVAAEGIAKTRYHGEQTITTDSLSPDSFVLNDKTRGSGIETLNMRTFTKLDSAVSFFDSDNYWDMDNAKMDNAATDVHWGSEMAYDYFLQAHSRNSYDGKGSKILSYVHYNKNWRNASWNGKYARYGDGTNNPLTSIDVVAHELTHGVTGTSAGLIYRNESGALNESFSDIFGTAVEFFALGDQANWAMGLANFKLREIDNPKKYGDPNCYGGVNWYVGPADNGGVHTNSGVQNYWFYLLSTGGSGTNDLGNTYTVDSIGMAKAAQIAYRNLTYYLTPSSTYADARAGSIEAAKDLFGLCSYEVEQVIRAWHAVGVGSEQKTQDLALVGLTNTRSSCSIAYETLEILFSFRESACDSLLKAGTELEFYYQIDQAPPVKEVMTLRHDLPLYDTLKYTYSTKADLTEINRYEIYYWLKYSEDFIPGNDSAGPQVITHKRVPNKDDVIGFEPKNYEEEKVLFSIEERSNSVVEIAVPARKDGIRGLSFTGEPGGRIRDFVGPETEEQIFNTHTEQIGKMCMCIDARSWDDITLSFDLRQTYSKIYFEYLKNYEPRLMTSFRVTVDGQQIDTIFHPDTTSMDPWEHITMNLDHYAKKEFSLCFEGKHFISRSSFSTENVGDYSFIDNINIAYTNLVPSTTAYNLKWYPNPTIKTILIESYQPEDAVLTLEFVDALGRVVLKSDISLVYGANNTNFNLSALSSGMYTLKTSIRGETRTEKIVIY
jgi:Zn-dependent metalloprotease